MMICEARHKGRVRGPSCVLTLVFFETPRRSETHSCALERLNPSHTFARAKRTARRDKPSKSNPHTLHYNNNVWCPRTLTPAWRGENSLVKKPKSTRLNASAPCEG